MMMRVVIEKFLQYLYPQSRFIITESYEIYKELIGRKRATVTVHRVDPSVPGSEVIYTLEEKGETYIPTEQLYERAYVELLKLLWDGSK